MRRLLWIFLVSFPLYAYVATVGAARGEVYAKHEGKLHSLYTGDKVHKKDEIFTKKGMVQLIFKDETIVTLGENSRMKIEKYLYDSKPQAKFFFDKGVFRTLTGKIGKIAPNRFKLKTKNATIGIRGTEILIKLLPNGEEYIACTLGAIEVISHRLSKTVDIRVGQMVTLLPNGIISAPKKIEPQIFSPVVSISSHEVAKKNGEVVINSSASISKSIAANIPDPLIYQKEQSIKSAISSSRLSSSFSSFSKSNSSVSAITDSTTSSASFSSNGYNASTSNVGFLSSSSRSSVSSVLSSIMTPPDSSSVSSSINSIASVFSSSSKSASASSVATIVTSSVSQVVSSLSSSFTSTKDSASSIFSSSSKNKVHHSKSSSVSSTMNSIDYSSVASSVSMSKSSSSKSSVSSVISSSMTVLVSSSISSKASSSINTITSVSSSMSSTVSSGMESLSSVISTSSSAASIVSSSYSSLVTSSTNSFDSSTQNIDSSSSSSVCHGFDCFFEAAESIFDRSLSSSSTSARLNKLYDNEYMGFGYWEEKRGPREFTVIGKPTSPHVINMLIKREAKASYYGRAAADVGDGVAKGDFEMNVDFGRQKVGGKIDMQHKKDRWAFGFEGRVKKSGFESAKVYTLPQSTKKIDSGTVQGGFYGPKAEAAGGTFTINKNINGAFGGMRSPQK